MDSEFFIWVIILIVSAIFGLIKKVSEDAKKRELEQRKRQPGSDRTQPKPSAQRTPWEEIREYLEGLGESPQAPPRPAPPRRPQRPEPKPAPREPEPTQPAAYQTVATHEGHDYLGGEIEHQTENFAQSVKDDLERASKTRDDTFKLQQTTEREETQKVFGTKDAPQRLISLLTGQSLRNAIVLSEILRPPLAERGDEER